MGKGVRYNEQLMCKLCGQFWMAHLYFLFERAGEEMEVLSDAGSAVVAGV